MPLVQLTNPTDFPVSYDEARQHLRILDNTQEAEIYRLLKASVESVEAIMGAALMPRTYRLDLDGFPSGEGTNVSQLSPYAIDLRIYPVQSISSFVYDNSSNSPNETSITLNTDYYQILSGRYPYVTPVTQWPSAITGKPGSVRISFTAGYAEKDDIPEDVKHAILVQLKTFYDFGNEWIQGTHATPINTVNHLLFQHKRISL